MPQIVLIIFQKYCAGTWQFIAAEIIISTPTPTIATITNCTPTMLKNKFNHDRMIEQEK